MLLTGGRIFPSPFGTFYAPNISPHADALAHWSIGDFTEYLESNFTPDFDSASGVMVDAIENTAQLRPRIVLPSPHI